MKQTALILTTLVVFFMRSMAISSDCKLTPHFNNTAFRSLSPKHQLAVDVQFQFYTPNTSNISFHNLSLRSTNHTYSPKTFDLLQLPFNVTLNNTSINEFNFSRNDQRFSKYLKMDIVDFVWKTRAKDNQLASSCLSVDNYVGRSGEVLVNETASAVPHIDRRLSGYISEAKNQGKCATCWAFPTVSLIEFMHFQVTPTHERRTFSTQFLTDCTFDQTHGCGGTMGRSIKEAFIYVKSNGIYLEDNYKWVNTNQACGGGVDPPGAPRFYRNGQFRIRQQPGLDVLNVKLLHGPVAAYVYIGPKSRWYRFQGNDILGDACKGKQSLNHAILVIGGGIDQNGQEFYYIKNSWGVGFGIDGFARLSANKKNNNCLSEFVYLEY